MTVRFSLPDIRHRESSKMPRCRKQIWALWTPSRCLWHDLALSLWNISCPDLLLAVFSLVDLGATRNPPYYIRDLPSLMRAIVYRSSLLLRQTGEEPSADGLSRQRTKTVFPFYPLACQQPIYNNLARSILLDTHRKVRSQPISWSKIEAIQAETPHLDRDSK